MTATPTPKPGLGSAYHDHGPIQPAYDAAAREAAHLMYRGSRTIDGQPRTWDTLHDTDKAACMAFAVPMVDAALAVLDFTEHTA